MVDKFLLLSGNDIPFPEARLTIHQPRLKEICLLGEKGFYIGCNILNFSIDSLPSQDKNNLKGQTNFDILMSIINDDRVEVQETKTYALLVLSMLFPQYHMQFEKYQIVFSKEGEEEKSYLNRVSFNLFQEILQKMFLLSTPEEEYNVQGELGKQIADKIKARRQKLAASKKHKDDEQEVLSCYISDIVTGNQKTYEEVYNYTLYQLLDEFNRYTRKMNYDIYLSAKMAGATGMDEVENWMTNASSDKD